MSPRASRSGRPVTAWVLGLCLFAAACQVDKAAFNQRLFTCNPNAADPACGTDAHDKAMACVPAYQLGGRNFCSVSCDVAQLDEDDQAVCVPSGPDGPVSGARLAKCVPPPPGSDINPCGQPELSCLRTDLIKDEGICNTVGSCHVDSDCKDPVRAKCMGELLRETYPTADFKADSTYCLQAGCRANRTSCSPGETCMRDVLPSSLLPPDICVPNCDANKNCPPNYFCYSQLFSSVSPAICIPGLLGLRCRTRLDCLAGDCVPTGAGFNMCTVPCANDDECAKYDSVYGTLSCNDQGYCASPRGFRGAVCYQDTDCKYPGEICARVTNEYDYKLCLQGCTAGSACTSYGGVPHACRPQIDAANNFVTNQPFVCWPGYFGQLCSADNQCIRGLGCRQIVPDNPIAKICTVACNTDDDCKASRQASEGYCEPNLHLCLSPLADGSPCSRGTQCQSGKCIGTGSDMKCDVTVY